MEWKYFNTKDIGSHIVIIIITVSLQLITSYLSFLSSTPSIIYNIDKIKNKMGSFFFIKITNYNKKTINGVQFRISKGEIDSLEIIGYAKIKKDFQISDSTNIILTINNIISSTTEYILIKGKLEVSNLEILESINSDDIVNSQQIIEKYRNFWKSQIISLSFNFVTVIIVFIIINIIISQDRRKSAIERNKANEELKKAEEERNKKNKELNDTIDRLEESLGTLQNNMQKSLTNMNKYKLLMLSRLIDYSKELNFWKNIIKSLLKSDNNDIFDLVTKQLKTYRTKDNFEDPELIKSFKYIIKKDKDKNKHKNNR